jgi:TolB-like protein
MTVLAKIAASSPPAAPTNAAVRSALRVVLGSVTFARAQRMRDLLEFLVEQMLSGSQRDTQEYAVGIEVFKRDPATYNTCTDPIVRVQVGRLRDRLRTYYQGVGSADTLRFIIPVGAYMPEIVSLSTPAAARAASGPAALAPRRPALGPIARHYQLAHCAVAYFDADPAGAAFVRGLDEELVHQLYSTFGATIVPYTGAGGVAAVSHRLEGSVRIDAGDGGLVRLSLRVVDNGAGSVVWSQQFDTAGALSIELQGRLAAAACAALARYFAHG